MSNTKQTSNFSTVIVETEHGSNGIRLQITHKPSSENFSASEDYRAAPDERSCEDFYEKIE